MRQRTTQTLPDGSDAQVKAFIMDDMDMQIASMARMVEEMLFTSAWDTQHGHFWRSPTGTWMRLAVESFVPKLEPHENQDGIQEALVDIFMNKAGGSQVTAIALPMRSETPEPQAP
eukprot:437594-Heterocapsa_arctica.AAC.1